ncbi:serine hydrolase domain-containing protein, partial [Undibacterium luofuense]
ADEFSGAVLIAKHGQVLFESVCGEASQRYHVPNKLDTKFNIASVGKMFTAVAIAQLVQAGRLSYDDTLDKFLDASWLPVAVSKRITVSQLLNHTSGLPEFLSRAKARHSS